MRIVLTFLTGPDTGRAEIFKARKLVIGRDSGCDLQFDLERDLEVSGQHAEIKPANIKAADTNSTERNQSAPKQGARSPMGFIITDLGSTNGTLINSVEIQSATNSSVHSNSSILSSGDIIQFGHGGPKLRFEIRKGLWVKLLGYLSKKTKKDR